VTTLPFIQAHDWGCPRKPQTVADKIIDNDAEIQTTRRTGMSPEEMDLQRNSYDCVEWSGLAQYKVQLRTYVLLVWLHEQ
jgi:hypothetical protein